MNQAFIDNQEKIPYKNSLRLRVYRDGDRLLVLFIIENDDSTYSTYWGTGDSTRYPQGDFSESVGPFPTFYQAQAAYETMVAMADEILNN